ncbi:uncharacterized protein C15orf61-like [Anneissia japonica]|uniref:uncharacterized protein C15orf61-like n=1 Tax=Anneissia japonica TaxID=1529436 RepID=UPI001425570B|nr:uncharacterized protein C15orf61-like [Anneissia japonica]
MTSRSKMSIAAAFSKLIRNTPKHQRPTSSEVLTCHLKQRNLPAWTSYFVRYSDINSDQFGLSHFNWDVDGTNYHILRTGCYPFIKYHCTKRPWQDLTLDNRLFGILKVVNFGIPCMAYGIVASFLITCEEEVKTSAGPVMILFLIKEDKDALF